MLLLTTLAFAAVLGSQQQQLSPAAIRGSGFAGGPMAAVQTPLGGAAANKSLAALAATGATHVRLYSTWYMAGLTSEAIAPSTDAASPLRSETDAELRQALAAAKKLGLQTILSPRLDFDWDSPLMANLAPFNASVASLGAGFSAAQWQAWFVSYSAFVHHHAALCAAAPGGCSGIVMADELHSAFSSVGQASWQALAASTREILPSGTALLVMTSQPDAIRWWGTLDMIGFNAEQTSLVRYVYAKADTIITTAISVPWPPLAFGLVAKKGQSTWGRNVTLAQCQEACSVGVSHSSGTCTAINWDSLTMQCYLFAHVTGRKAAGSSTWRSFAQTVATGGAESCADTAGLVRTWKADGIIQTLAKLHTRYDKPVIVSFGYQSRPDAHRALAGALRPGYTDCSVWVRCYDDACQASLAEAALAAFSGQPFFGGALWSYWSTDPSQGGRSDSSRSPRGKVAEGVLRKWFGADSISVPPIDVSSALPTPEEALNGAAGDEQVAPAPAGSRNGYVFGTGEWSATNLTLAEAKQSMDMAVEAGVNALEFMVTWYALDGVSSTSFYPAPASSPLATVSDADLTALFKYAKQKHNLVVAFTPFLDPICNDPTEGCESYWRGSLCQAFNTSQYDQFFASYSAIILKYARLAEESGAVDEYFISHELATCIKNAPDHYWITLLEATRKVFSGKLAVALNWGPFTSSNPEIIPAWLSKLDFLGLDCYYFNQAARTLPPSRPWELPTREQLLAGWTTTPMVGSLSWVEAIANYSHALGDISIVCTEVGYQSKPKPWLNPAGTSSLDTRDCTVQSLCVSTASQALSYEVLFSALYPQKWFEGFYLWLWRSDPSAGGPSDDSFGGSGKPETLAVLDRWWKKH